MGAEDDDWRLTGQDEYMSGVTLVWLPYRQWSETWDHDHCMFCWAKFVPEGIPSDAEAEHEGYTNEGVPDVADHYCGSARDASTTSRAASAGRSAARDAADEMPKCQNAPPGPPALPGVNAKGPKEKAPLGGPRVRLD